MARHEVARYQEGDRLDDGRGSIGHVRQCTGKQTGKKFLRVYVSEGPRKGDWEWPERFAPPALDWDADGLNTVCVDCQRVFRGGKDASGLRRILCRQCDRGEQRAVRTMEATADMNDTLKRARWMEQHRRTATDDVEDLIAESVRGEQS